MAVELLGFPTTLGLPRRVVRDAPEALRAAGLREQLAALGASVEDLGDFPFPPGDGPDAVHGLIQRVVDSARLQAEHWLKVHKPGQLMITIGGDHTTSLGTMWALHQMGQSFDVVWVDAHGDFNIRETSPSGNPHGMVLALACGLLPSFMPAVVEPSALNLWGIRELDPGEKKLLEREQVSVLSPDQVRQSWDQIVTRLGPHVFLSFDMDSVDPGAAPGTMTPVAGGFHRQEALDLVARLSRHRHLLALDVVELHPDYDRGDVTVNLALELIGTAVSNQAHRGSGLTAAAGL